MFLKVVVLLMAVCFAVASADLLDGGLVNADINEKGVQDALQFALAHYNKASSDEYFRAVSKTISAQKQRPDGVRYHITVELSRTTCKKGGAGGVCPIHSDPKLAKVGYTNCLAWQHGEAWRKKMSSPQSLQEVEALLGFLGYGPGVEGPREVVVLLMAVGFAVASLSVPVGAPVNVDIKEKGVRDALQFAVIQYNQASSDRYFRDVSEVISAQKQAVQGVKYIFTVEMSRTTCKKGAAGGVCPIQADPELAKAQVCNFEVWSRPWLNSIQLVKNTCV
ncbi:hypothetical protein NFI96_024840 [Prochilodus magdalenae]|nr:hypothetical protein NFI96_024840 [Prochilodus magdalenae]